MPSEVYNWSPIPSLLSVFCPPCVMELLLPHTPSSMMFCPRTWNQENMEWTLWNYESAPHLSSLKWFLYLNIQAVAWSLLIALRQVYSEHWEQNKKKKRRRNIWKFFSLARKAYVKLGLRKAWVLKRLVAIKVKPSTLHQGIRKTPWGHLRNWPNSTHSNVKDMKD
jgi:hypothetical protein